jgi:hypothetical protein
MNDERRGGAARRRLVAVGLGVVVLVVAGVAGYGLRRPTSPVEATSREAVRRVPAPASRAAAETAASSPTGTGRETQALALLMERLKADGVYARRLRLECIETMTEDVQPDEIEFALHEKHDAHCGGDPGVSPVVDRYRVYAQAGRIEWYDVADDEWRAYDPKRVR